MRKAILMMLLALVRGTIDKISKEMAAKHL